VKAIFDLDGTLVSTDSKQCFAMQSAADLMGVEFDVRHFWSEKRSGKNNVQALVGQGIPIETAEHLNYLWLGRIETYQMQKFDTVLYGVVDALSLLRGKGYSLQILTARKNSVLMRQQIIKLRLAKWFDEITCVNPEGAVLEKTAVLRTEKPNFYFGDSEVDFEAAKISKTAFYAVETGQRSGRFLLSTLGIEAHSNLLIAVQKAIEFR
jgi:phosphoglycolate phosphatase-like HAD superfamily hydrolase